MILRNLKKLIPDQHPLRLLWHRSKAFAAALRYGFPARRLTVVGITGTDGKTTTVGMVAHILQTTGIQTGALSTAFFRIGDDIEWNATQKTSPSPFLIQSFLRRAKKAGCTHAVIEFSSHGLIQSRTLFTWPTVAAVTNVAEEHLDYHGTMKHYIAAKGRLFAMLKGRGTKVLNGADPTYATFRSFPSRQTVTYKSGGERTDMRLYLEQIKPGNTASAVLRATIPGHMERTFDLTLAIPGEFNLENALCAVGCAVGCGVSMEDAVKALTSFPGIPGRMERIDGTQPFAVFVDFTVTPQSYEKTLSTIRAGLPAGGRLLVLTGSCGDRMKEKRPVIGRIVSSFADVTVVANEDPYTEDPEKIIDEVWAGIDQSRTQAYRIFDRRAAIAFLLKEARPGDTVLLCGKGSDTTMWTKEGKIPWNEREIVRELLQQK